MSNGIPIEFSIHKSLDRTLDESKKNKGDPKLPQGDARHKEATQLETDRERENHRRKDIERYNQRERKREREREKQTHRKTAKD